MTPADEGLAAGDPSGREIDDRLVEDLELVPAERFPQFLLQVTAGDRPRRHGSVEEFDRVAAARFGLAERRVGALQDGERIGLAGLQRRDAGTHPGDQAVGVHLVGRVAAGDQPFRQGLPARHGIFPGQDDGEVVAAETGDEVVGAGHLPQAAGDRREQAVTDAGPERIVDRLEAVEVE